MFRVCTAGEMRKSDRDCIEIAGIPGIVLMENAARGCVDELVSRFGNLKGKKVACFCGKGNNGGDGLAIARLLSRHGAEVKVFLTHGDFYIGDAAINREILSHMDVEIIDGTDEIEYYLPLYDIVVDSIFGTGLKGEIDDDIKNVIEKINRYSEFILAVDIPSGVEADTGRICGACVNADVTVTFAGYKTGQFMFPGSDYTGDIKVCDICTPEQFLSDIRRYCTDFEFVKDNFPIRRNNSQKGDYGKVLIIGGSAGMTGAPVMSASAALKSGAGLVTVGIAKSLNGILEVKLTEAMTAPLKDENGHLSYECRDKVAELMEKADTVLFGPGLGTDRAIRLLLEFVMKNCKVPLIIDADGLNVLSEDLSIIESCSCSLIFTPHEVEMSRLCGCSLSEVTENRLELSDRFAQEYSVTLILKGHHTIVTASDGTQYINITGNPGMATGGSGDVLAGILASVVSRGIKEDIAAAMAVYVHGKCADYAAEKFGEDGMSATDIIEYLPEVIKRIHNR